MGALFDAFKRYRTDHDHAKQRDDELPTRVRIESLSFVEDSAQPMWLWTWIFPDEAGPQPWLVADPFGLAAGGIMVAQAIAGSPAAKRWCCAIHR
jgi:hypothetical protein